MTDADRSDFAGRAVDVAVAGVSDDLGVEAVAGIAVQGSEALIVAQFADMGLGQAGATTRSSTPRRSEPSTSTASSWPNADFQGKIDVQKMT